MIKVVRDRMKGKRKRKKAEGEEEGAFFHDSKHEHR